MHNIILAIHVILAILLIVVVLMQRSEGGGLGIGGGGNAKAASRGGLEAIGKFTWILAAGFVITSLTLTVMAARSSGSSTVLDIINSLPSGGESTSEAPAEAPVDALPLLPSEEPTAPTSN